MSGVESTKKIVAYNANDTEQQAATIANDKQKAPNSVFVRNNIKTEEDIAVLNRYNKDVVGKEQADKNIKSDFGEGYDEKAYKAKKKELDARKIHCRTRKT
jgi:hypothetical protein